MNPIIKVIGVGGSGSNTVSRIAKLNVLGIELAAVNTDAQALYVCKVDKKVLIGEHVTKGLGAGMDVQMGKAAAEENRKELAGLVKGADMIFITCGLGGGTGSGASPILAEITRELGILTIAVVTTPFTFEGEQRKNIAVNAIASLRERVDALLIVSNDRLLRVVDEKTTVSSAFAACDDILKQAVQSITDLMLAPGIISIDFASVVSIMKNSGQTLFGTGIAQGQNRATMAADKAINSPLLDFSIKGAKGVLFNVSGSDMSLNEIKAAAKVVTENVDPRAKIVFGAIKDDTLRKGEVKVTVIATKF